MANEKDELERTIRETNKLFLSALGDSYSRYNNLVSDLIKVLDLDFTDTRSLKIRVLEVIKESLYK